MAAMHEGGGGDGGGGGGGSVSSVSDIREAARRAAEHKKTLAKVSSLRLGQSDTPTSPTKSGGSSMRKAAADWFSDIPVSVHITDDCCTIICRG